MKLSYMMLIITKSERILIAGVYSSIIVPRVYVFKSIGVPTFERKIIAYSPSEAEATVSRLFPWGSWRIVCCYPLIKGC